MERTFDIQTIKQRFGIIGNSPALNHAVQVAMQVAPTDMTVLINGESGSGKESFSKIIHALSSRKHGQFIAVNCGAIPAGTIDSELFGHEKGSFTGASDARKGYFEVTDKGTIFLDEIGEMPLETQSRLLRVLENKEFIRVGSSKAQTTDVRIVAATNKDLIEQVSKGKFREDLYYRLSTVPIKIPPLRERGGDIHLLFRKFATDHAEKYRVQPITLTEEAVKILLAYRFPGNIRELKNITERISVLEINRTIDAQTLKGYLPDTRNTLPALSKEFSQYDFTERDILYKFLFEMKHDLTELKKLVFENLKGNMSGSQIIEKNKSLFNDLEHSSQVIDAEMPYTSSVPKNPIIIPNANTEDQEEEEIFHEHEVVNDNLSLEDMEKNMILKALDKYKNKRKYAADELGISERTLYRKLKQYNIE